MTVLGTRVVVFAAPAFLAAFLFLQNLAHAQAPPPPYFQELIRVGHVGFDFYDPRQKPRRFPAWTSYELKVFHQYTYTSKHRDVDEKVLLTIRPRVEMTGYDSAIRILLPESYREDRRWNSPMVAHEFDHVAAIVDPRVRMLVEHLYAGIGTIERKLDPSDPIGEDVVRKILDSEVLSRRAAVMKLVNDNGKLLDTISRNGTLTIPERETFFRWMYTKPNLDRLGFPYTGEVLDLLKSEAYQQVKLSYR